MTTYDALSPISITISPDAIRVIGAALTREAQRTGHPPERGMLNGLGDELRIALLLREGHVGTVISDRRRTDHTFDLDGRRTDKNH
jgi:hypothetical protein